MLLTLKPRKEIKCQSEEYWCEEGSIKEDSDVQKVYPVSFIYHGLLEDAADNSRSREELVQRDVEIVGDRA